MYLSTSFRGAMYTQYILLRSSVSHTHPFKKLSTPRAYFHHLTCVTYKHVVHMRSHHKISIIGFQIYFMHTWFSKYQAINNIYNQIVIWIHNSTSYTKSDFCNHEAILILFGFCKWEYLSPTYTCCPKPGHPHTACHLDTIVDQPNTQ